MKIEDRLRKFDLAALPPGLKRRTLAAAKPWRPWYLAAAAACLLACAGANAWSEARFHRALTGPGVASPGAPPAGSMAGRFVTAAPPSIRAESLISLKRLMENDWQ